MWERNINMSFPKADNDDYEINPAVGLPFVQMQR
jgi:hypothetical protein